jgi:hypothetical protein
MSQSIATEFQTSLQKIFLSWSFQIVSEIHFSYSERFTLIEHPQHILEYRPINGDKSTQESIILILLSFLPENIGQSLFDF